MERKIGDIFTLGVNEFKVLESKNEFCFECYFINVALIAAIVS